MKIEKLCGHPHSVQFLAIRIQYEELRRKVIPVIKPSIGEDCG